MTDLTKKEPTPQERAVALLEAKAKETQVFIEGFRGEIQKSLPKFIDGDRMMNIIFTTMRKNPKLYQAERGSLINAILTSAQLGLECDGVLGQATILPYTNNSKGGIIEAQFQPMYRGLVDLLYRTGLVSNIHTGIVYENEYKDEKHWEYELGYDAKLRHRPMPPYLRGEEKVGAYCVILLKDGTKHSAFMWASDILKRRDASPGWKAAKKYGTTDASPWTQWEEGMWAKTTVKEACKLMKMSSEDVSIRKALAADDDYEHDDGSPGGRTGVIDAEVVPTSGTAAFDKALGAGEPTEPTDEEKTAEANRKAAEAKALADKAAADKKKAPPATRKTTPPASTTPPPAGNPDRANADTVAKIKALANEVIANYNIAQTDFLERFTKSPQGVPLTALQFRNGEYSEQDARRYNHVIKEYITITEAERKDEADRIAEAERANAAGSEPTGDDKSVTDIENGAGSEPGATEPERIGKLDSTKHIVLAQIITECETKYGVTMATILSGYSDDTGEVVTSDDVRDGFVTVENYNGLKQKCENIIAARKSAPTKPNRSVAPPPDEKIRIRDAYLTKSALSKAERQALAGDILSVIVDNPDYLTAAKAKYGESISQISTGVTSNFIELWYNCQGDFDAAIAAISSVKPSSEPGKLF